jgi:hypothetical protein
MTFEKFPFIFTILTPLQYIKIVVGNVFCGADPDPIFLVNADTDTGFFNAVMDPDPDPGL